MTGVKSMNRLWEQLKKQIALRSTLQNIIFYIYVMYLSEAFVQCNVIMLSFTDRRLVCGMLL